MTEHHPFHSLGPYVYCSLCGGPLEITGREELPRRFCPGCDHVYYHNPAPAAGGVIVQEERVLLVKRKFPPRVGDWTLPAGFLEYFEAPDACAVREIKEETGLDAVVRDIFEVYAGHDDPRQTAVLILYRMDVLGGALTPGDDAQEARFFDAATVPETIAFRAHKFALWDLFGDRLKTSWAQPIGQARRKNREAGGRIP